MISVASWRGVSLSSALISISTPSSTAPAYILFSSLIIYISILGYLLFSNSFLDITCTSDWSAITSTAVCQGDFFSPMKFFTNCVFGCRRSEENTSELQSRGHLVCHLLFEIINHI